ncbi:SynChlorMet cassette protein ScmC [bacterium]|nr:SynChlorMet cassette protein ScmC [bacterium]
MSIAYHLQLADGTCWQFEADTALTPWLADFASILSLPAAADPPDSSSWTFSVHSTAPSTLSIDSLQWSMYGVNFQLSESEKKVSAVVPASLEGERRIYSMWSMVQPLYRRATLRGGGPLHAALLARHGVGVLIAAPGGTGKTTTFHRFSEPWKKVTDDELLAVNTDSGYVIHPFPTWSRFLLDPGNHRWNVNQMLPLGACFFMQQGEDVQIDRLGQSEAAVLIHQSMRQILRRGWQAAGTAQEKRLKLAAFDSSSELAKQVPCWRLTLPLEGTFSDQIEEVLRREGVWDE